MFPELTRDEVFMIGTQRLWLRWPRLGDAGALAAISGHADVAPKIGSWPLGCDAGYATERIKRMRAGNEDGSMLCLVITKREHWSSPIGLVGIAHGVAPGQVATGFLGYHLDPSEWARGYAGEAVAGLVNMTRLLTRLVSLTAAALPDNPASARVLVKNGFERSSSGSFVSAFRGVMQVEHYERTLRGKSARRHVSTSEQARAVA